MSASASGVRNREVDTVDTVDMAAKDRFGAKRKRHGENRKYVQPYRDRRRAFTRVSTVSILSTVGVLASQRWQTANTNCSALFRCILADTHRRAGIPKQWGRITEIRRAAHERKPT